MPIPGRGKEENVNILGHLYWLKKKIYLSKSPVPTTAISTGIAKVELEMSSMFEQSEALGLPKLDALSLFLITLDYNISQLNWQCSYYSVKNVSYILIRLSFVHL